MSARLRFARQLVLVTFLLLRRPPVVVVHSREADARYSSFLYSDNDENKEDDEDDEHRRPSSHRKREDDRLDRDVVSDYHIHRAEESDYVGAEQEEHARRPPGVDDEGTHVRPHYLRPSADHPARVVQFYSPWDGASRRFRTTYTETAREVKRRWTTTVEFHAISCSAYHWVCAHNGVSRVEHYPTVVALPAGSDARVPLDVENFSAEAVVEALGLEPSTLRRDAPTNSTTTSASDHHHHHRGPHVDILAASANVYRRVRREVYADAALSLTHALVHDVHRDAAELDPVRHDALVEWIDLLCWTLPPTWRLHTLVHDLRDDVVAGSTTTRREATTRSVAAHADVVREEVEWSPGCDHACGLLNLLHVVTVGVAERRGAVLGARHRATPEHAFETIRNWLEIFYDDDDDKNDPNPNGEDGGRRAHRLAGLLEDQALESWRRTLSRGRKNGGSGGRRRKNHYQVRDDDRKQLALWLWEAHNSLNARQRGSIEDWPSETECRHCRYPNGRWDRDAVYDFLRSVYWPDGAQNFRYVVLDDRVRITRARDGATMDPGRRRTRISWARSAATAVGLFLLLSHVSERRRVARTGRHKKHDAESV